jgi:hypothetical protein
MKPPTAEEGFRQEAERAAPPEPRQPEYEPPRVVTHRGAEILEELGPAQACSFNHSVLICL